MWPLSRSKKKRDIDDKKVNDIQWITVKGRHIPIKPGQSKDDAVKQFLKDDDKEPKKDTSKNQLKTKGRFNKPELKKKAEDTINKAINSMPDYLKKHADNITLTDKPTSSGRKEFGGGYNMFTGEITIQPSGDQGYNNGVLAHELSHKQYDSLSKQKKDEWNKSEIMLEPVTDYTKKILNEYGDSIVSVGGIKTNLFRDEQYAELSRIINTEPTKYMAPITSKSINKQKQFFKKFNELNESVDLSGPQATAQIKKKKRHFEFVETTNDVWKEVAEARFKAFTHSSSFVGNVKYDQDNQTMEIILNGKKYDFCNVSERLFDAFEGADSKGAFFNREIKSLHDC